MVASRNAFVVLFSLNIIKADSGKLSTRVRAHSFQRISAYLMCRWSSCGAAATWRRVVSSWLSVNAASLSRSTFGAWEYLWAVSWTCSLSALIYRSNTYHCIKTLEVCCLLPKPLQSNWDAVCISVYSFVNNSCWDNQ